MASIINSYLNARAPDNTIKPLSASIITSTGKYALNVNIPGGINVNPPPTQAISGSITVNNTTTNPVISALYTSTGTALTSTNITGGIKALDVNLAGGNITLDNVSSKTLDGAGNSITSTVVTTGIRALDVNLAGGNISVGSVSVSNFPTTQAISGSVSVSNLPTTQAISGSVSVSNFPTTITVNNIPITQAISGSVSISNLPTTQAISGSVSVSNLPTTQAISGSVSVSNLPTTQEISGSVSVSNFPTNITVNNFPTTQAISGAVFISNNITNPVISALYTSTGDALTSTSITGGLKALDVNLAGGNITLDNVSSKTLDGAGNSITSTVVTTGVRALDVNLASGTVSIGSVSVSNFPTTQAISGAVSISNFPTTITVNNFPSTQAISGAVSVSNFPSTQAISGSILVSNNTTNPVVSALYTSIGDALTSTTVATGIIGVDTASALYTTDGTTRTALATTQNDKISTFPLATNAIGLNMYVIPSKTKTFSFNAYTNNTGGNAMLGSINTSITFSFFNYGLANPKVISVVRSSTTSTTLNATINYIDALGNEQTYVYPAPLPTVITQIPNITMISINSWKTNTTLTTNDVISLCSGNSITYAVSGGSYYQNNNSQFTCPNNAIAWVQNVSFYSNTVDNLRLFKWDVNGVRSTMFSWTNASNFNSNATGEYGFGGYITAGETIGWGGELSTTSKLVYSNIVVRYL